MSCEVTLGSSGETEKSKLNTSSGEFWSRVGERGGGWAVLRRGIGIGVDGLERVFKDVAGKA